MTLDSVCPMADFSDLPTEIQLLVARDLPRSDLFKLRSLNSLFFNQWMDTRWKIVRVELRYPDLAVRLLQRVVDPFVATRLKMLTIDLDQKEPPSSPELTISKLPKPESRTSDGAMTVLLDSLPHLLNMTCLTIQIFENFTFDLATFFQRIASLSCASKLSQSLTELNLYLTDNPVTQTKLSLSLEHFLRSLAPTLQWLYIWTAIDLCPLFNALSQPLSLSQSHPSVPFPNLTSLFLRLYLDTSLRSDQPFCRFLLIHNNLQHLHLRIHGVSDPEIDESVAILLTELVNHNDRLPSLRTLDIYPTMTQVGLSALLTLIKRSTPTLTSLEIPFRYLTDEEANRVIDALTEDGVRVPGMTTTTREEPRKLKSLKMRISCLSVPFLDLLARKLPQLERLDLLVNNITGSDEHSFYEQLCQRRYDPNITCSQDILHAWKLQNLSIYWDWYNEIHSKRAEHAVMGAVPALARSGDVIYAK